MKHLFIFISMIFLLMGFKNEHSPADWENNKVEIERYLYNSSCLVSPNSPQGMPLMRIDRIECKNSSAVEILVSVKSGKPNGSSDYIRVGDVDYVSFMDQRSVNIPHVNGSWYQVQILINTDLGYIEPDKFEIICESENNWNLRDGCVITVGC